MHNRMRESHHPKERIQCPDQIQTIRDQHPPQSRVPLPNRMRESHIPRERAQCPDQSGVLLPNRMRESHTHRERTRCPNQVRATKKQHLPQSKVPHLNRLLAPAESPCVHPPWYISQDMSNRKRDTRQRRSACRGQSHQNNQRKQGPLTSDIADASDITRDGNQHLF